MDNKIIFELIKKDIEELRLIVEAIEKSEEAQPLLVGIATTKTENLLHELSLLKPEIQDTQIPASVSQDEEIQIEKKTEALIVTPPTNTNEEEEEPILLVEEKFVDVALKDEPDNKIDNREVETIEINAKVATEEIISPANTNPLNEINHIADAEKSAVNTEEGNDTLAEPSAELADSEEGTTSPAATGVKPLINGPEKPAIVLGEKFTKEPTLNERFSVNTENQYKIKGKPVTSIKGAIGLNDRFLYMRELFGNNQETFETAIETLDKASALLEAIEYLEQNFQWQKNETSLKFMELVKRRFDN